MAENKGKKPISGALKIFYGVGDCGFTLMSNIESYYFNFFLTNLAAFPLAVVTMITTIASTVDACLSWMYGAIINSTKPMKWGRYRSWLIAIPWLVPFLYAFQFVKVGDGVVSYVIITVAAIASHVAWNFAYVANVSMISVAGATPEDRSQLASTRAAWANLSKVIFSYIGPVVASIFAGMIGEINQYGGAAFALGCVMAILYYCHFVMFKGYEETSADAAQAQAQAAAAAKAAKDKTSPMDLIRSLAQNPPLIALLIADLAKFMFNFVCMGVATYYFTYVAGNGAMLAKYILVTNIFCVIGAYLSKPLSNKFSTRTTAIAVMAIQAVLLFVCFAFYNNTTMCIALMAVCLFGYGITYACTPALYGDTIVYAEWKTGKNAAGWISGLQNVPLKVSIMTRGIIISACLAAGGFSADITEAPEALKKWISIGFMVVPAIALVIAVIALVFGFRLTKDKVMQYQAEIAARN